MYATPNNAYLPFKTRFKKKTKHKKTMFLKKFAKMYTKKLCKLDEIEIEIGAKKSRSRSRSRLDNGRDRDRDCPISTFFEIEIEIESPIPEILDVYIPI